MMNNPGKLTFHGLAEFAQRLPDHDWYEIKVRIRKLSDGAEVYMLPDVENVETGELAPIEFRNDQKRQ